MRPDTALLLALIYALRRLQAPEETQNDCVVEYRREIDKPNWLREVIGSTRFCRTLPLCIELDEHVALSIRSAQLAEKSGYAVGAWRNTTCGAVLLF